MTDLELSLCKEWVQRYRNWNEVWRCDTDDLPPEALKAFEVRDIPAEKYEELTGKQICMAFNYDSYTFKIIEGNNAQNMRVIYEEDA